MPRQPQTTNLPTNCPVSAQSLTRAVSRTKVAYWRSRLEKVKSKSGASSPDYSVRIVYKNRRVRFPLNTPNKDAAANKAAEIFKYLLEHGWDDTIASYKPNAKPQQPEESVAPQSTIGDLVAANVKFSSAREQSIITYAKSLRRIVAGVMALDKRRKFPLREECGNVAWKTHVDAVALDELTPALVQTWKQQFLKANASNGKKSITTVNSLIRNAKALLSKKLLPFLEQELALPSPLPFEGVTMEKPPSCRYHSQIDAKRIMEAAKTTLKEDEPEAYKIFLLALACGLRISEIDHLMWSAFNFAKNILTIEDNTYHRLKSEDSAGEIHLDAGMAALFQVYQKQAGSAFVINSHRPAGRTAGSSAYRCKRHIETLKTWLRNNGVNAPKPIHELRKEIGSVIASEQGIFAASRYLRHSDIRITAAIYADQKQKIVPSVVAGFGKH
ncbi:MAG: tyrosine-type recombinase/integrase [Akkermansiaceae bacterium]